MGLALERFAMSHALTSPSSTKIAVPSLHDRFFGQAFRHQEVAAAEIRRILSADQLRHLNLAGLALDETSLLDANYRKLFSDRLFRVPLKSEGEVFIWLLIEHRSTDQRLMPLRLLEYAASRWRAYRTLHKETQHIPLLIPIVIQHGPKDWTAPRTFSELYNVSEDLLADVGPYAIDFQYLLDDLHAETEQELAARCPSVALRAVLLALKSRGHVKAHQARTWSELFTQLEDEQNPELMEDLLWYLLQGGSKDMIHKLEKDNATVQQATENIWDRKFNEGFAEGEAKGLREGEARGQIEGARQALRIILMGRPDLQITDDMEARLRSASMQQVKQWIGRLAGGESPAAVFDL